MKMATFWTSMRKMLSEVIYPENVTLNEKILRELEKYQKQGNNKSELEIYYDDKYPKTDILYYGRILPTKEKNIEIDIRNFFTINDSKLRKLVESFNLSQKTDDEKAVICMKWIINNIKYISDTTKGYSEFWQFAYETLEYMTGDCEDMSILLANMLIISGIPSWKIRLNAGDVDDKRGSRGGHCFPVYYCESADKWVLLDCCFYPNTSAIEKRKDYKEETYYLSTWFSWSKDYCWTKDVRDIPKLDSVTASERR